MSGINWFFAKIFAAFFLDFKCIMLLIIGSYQKTTVMLSMKLKHDVKWTEYIGKMSANRQILMFSETRFNILFRIARARYSDILDGHRDRKED